MPNSDKGENGDGSVTDGGREKSTKSKQSSSSKSKDLSHVPCKFFKVGSCTAGASCPFSHTVPESGAQKDVCAWFVKGNCKFGHKCALAHILPGQPMSMDKKNKKAAQAAAAAAGGKETNKSARAKGREGQGNGSGSGRNSLFAGSTAPTRVLASNRSGMPMSLKASLSPSAPAPPLKDTEFAHFGLPEEDNKLDTAPAHTKRNSIIGESGTPEATETLSTSQTTEIREAVESKTTPPPASRDGLPVNSSTRPGLSHQARSSNPDFGPIGSPPRSVTSGSSIPRVNGFSPGTSPFQANNYPTSPFSAPGTQSVFISIGEDHEQNDMRFRSGIATSLGAAQAVRSWNAEGRPRGLVRNPGAEEAVVDEELEDFIPGSLTDLLTPEERSRRMSRSNSGQSPLLNPISRDPNLASVTGESNVTSHRYSRSVPAASLLGDIRSIWSNQQTRSPGPTNAVLLPASPADQSHMSGLAINGLSSSFKSGSGFGGRSFTENQFSPDSSLLSPSNASAAFLPGLHHQYLKNKTLGGSSRPTNSGLYPTANNGPTSGGQFQPSTTLHTSHMHNAFSARGNQGSVTTSDNLLSSGRPIPTQTQNSSTDSPSGLMGDLGTSPSTRALRSHAPGQSLPQGLAAGYSRIHALPPLPSPSASGTSPAFAASISPAVNTTWASLAASGSPAGETKLGPGTTPPPSGGTTANAALESMFSRLSYSAATSRASPSSSGPATPRSVSGGRAWQNAPTNAQSPLSGPAVTGDEDELFSMDG